MRTFALGAVLASTGLFLAWRLTAPLPEAAPVSVVGIAHESSTAVTPATLTQVVQQYCVVCHNDALLTGNLSLQGFAVENAADRAETAERMIRKLRAGMMPP